MNSSIKGKILQLFKNILLHNPSQFNEYIEISFEFKYEFWIKYDSIHQLALTMLDKDNTIQPFDIKTIEECIISTIKSSVSISSIFDTSEILRYEKKTLYECRASRLDANSFAQEIYSRLYSKLQNSLDSWLVLFPLTNIISDSFYIDSELVGILKNNDHDKWQEIKSFGYKTLDWSPSKPKLDSFLAFTPDSSKYITVLYVFTNGTKIQVNELSTLKVKKLISVIFAIINQNNIRYLRSTSQPESIGIFCGKQTSISLKWDKQNELLPNFSFGMNHHYSLKQIDIERIQLWFNSVTLLNDDNLKTRIDVSAHFINMAMNSFGISEFINYFISLDALFGINGKNKESILSGIKSLLNNSVANEKMKYLYNLRNDFIHGGVRVSQEWQDYRKYINRFHSTPENDIKEIAFSCFLLSPQISTSVTNNDLNKLRLLLNKINFYKLISNLRDWVSNNLHYKRKLG